MPRPRTWPTTCNASWRTGRSSPYGRRSVERLIRWCGRHKPVLMAAAVLGTLAAVGLIACTILVWREKEAAKASAAEAEIQRQRAEANFSQALFGAWELLATPRRCAPGRRTDQVQGPAQELVKRARNSLRHLSTKRSTTPSCDSSRRGPANCWPACTVPINRSHPHKIHAAGRQALRSPRHGRPVKRCIARTRPRPITRWVSSTNRSNSRPRPTRSGPGRSSSAGWPCPMMNGRDRERSGRDPGQLPGRALRSPAEAVGLARKSGRAGVPDGRVLEYPGRRPVPGRRISARSQRDEPVDGAAFRGRRPRITSSSRWLTNASATGSEHEYGYDKAVQWMAKRSPQGEGKTSVPGRGRRNSRHEKVRIVDRGNAIGVAANRRGASPDASRSHSGKNRDGRLLTGRRGTATVPASPGREVCALERLLFVSTWTHSLEGRDRPWTSHLGFANAGSDPHPPGTDNRDFGPTTGPASSRSSSTPAQHLDGHE